ncbi:MAG: hypothetical protein K2X82_30200 [Gemmataceae bacterium]|nr:hypothetical protein [Gemmataceae bacterium]
MSGTTARKVLFFGNAAFFALIAVAQAVLYSRMSDPEWWYFLTPTLTLIGAAASVVSGLRYKPQADRPDPPARVLFGGVAIAVAPMVLGAAAGGLIGWQTEPGKEDLPRLVDASRGALYGLFAGIAVGLTAAYLWVRRQKGVAGPPAGGPVSGTGPSGP